MSLPLAALAVVVLLWTIAALRFYSAYFDRYRGQDGRRFPIWPWDMAKKPWDWLSMFQRLDDPGVEHYRRQYLLAWGVFVASFVLYLVSR